MYADRALHECPDVQRRRCIGVHELRSRLLPLGRWLSVRAVYGGRSLQLGRDLLECDGFRLRGVPVRVLLAVESGICIGLYGLHACR